jgi:hypothetical protein
VKLTNQVHGLSKEQLAARQVEYIDIAFPGSDCWSHLVGKCSVDFSKFKSARTGRGPLLKGWQVGISLHIFIFVNEVYLECIVLILLFPFFEGRLSLTFYLFILCSGRVPRSLTSLHTEEIHNQMEKQNNSGIKNKRDKRFYVVRSMTYIHI